MLLVGAGEMAELAGRHLVSAGARPGPGHQPDLRARRGPGAGAGWRGGPLRVDGGEPAGWPTWWSAPPPRPAPVITRERVAAGAEAPASPAAVPGGPGSAARRRARSAHAGRRLRLRRGRHPEGGGGEHRVAAPRRRRERRRWSPRRSPASSASARFATEFRSWLSSVRGPSRSATPSWSGPWPTCPAPLTEAQAAGRRGDDLGHRQQDASPAHGQAARRLRRGGQRPGRRRRRALRAGPAARRTGGGEADAVCASPPGRARSPCWQAATWPGSGDALARAPR